MPPVSERQKRAMEAAAHGHSTLGISKEVGEEFVGKDSLPKTLYVHRPLLNGLDLLAWAKEQGFSVTLPADDLHVTIAFSKAPVDWNALTPRTGNVVVAGGPRIVEALGDKGAIVLRFESERLDERHQQFGDAGASWDHPSFKPHVTITYDGGAVDLSKVTPFEGALEFGPEVFGEVNEKWLESVKMVGAQDSIAMDRSVRRIDQDGHLFVETTPISKAVVNPYYGREIPGCDRLGLDPDRIYNLLRDPKELEKAAPTFAGKPLLLIHKPVNADEHPREIVVGSIGDDVEFKAPYLMAPLNIWDGEAIKLIESNERRELSCGYQYEPVMEAGIYEGEPFQGRMTNIKGNHLSLVSSGRAGPDVVVGDEALKPTVQEAGMAKKIAQSKARTAALTKALEGKIAQDAQLEDVIKSILALDEEMPKAKAEDEDMEDEQEAMDEDGDEKDKKAEDESEEDDDKKAEDEDKEEMVSKKAMDAALAIATKTAALNAEKATMARLNSIRDAEEAVRPYVGKMVAMDSADAIYRAALSSMQVDVSDVKELPALKAILKAQPIPGSNVQQRTTKVAMDAKGVSSFHELYPEAKSHIVKTL